MADEVIIEEYHSYKIGMNTHTVPVTTQVLDIAVLSAQLNAETNMIRVQSKGVGFWLVFGGSAASAAADTNGNIWVPADASRDFIVNKGSGLYIDTAADA